MQLKLNGSDNYESTTIKLNKEDHPIAFENRVQSLINSGLNREDAEKEAIQPIELEFYYDPDTGLFAVESEAVEAGTIYNPYTQEQLLEE